MPCLVTKPRLFKKVARESYVYVPLEAGYNSFTVTIFIFRFLFSRLVHALNFSLGKINLFKDTSNFVIEIEFSQIAFMLITIFSISRAIVIVMTFFK